MLLLLACVETESNPRTVGSVDPEPLVLPDDPAARGVPVGQSTVEANWLTAEVWYPASDDHLEDATDPADFAQFVPQALVDKVGAIDFPYVDSMAVRDAAPRYPEGDGYPVVLFSHGLGAMRIQSIDYAAHLASRGYVVVAADHPGRRFEDLVPCVFSPPLDGCDLSGMSSDPAVDDVDALVDWVVDGGLADFHADASRLGLSGHSAGGGTTTTVTSSDARVDAALVMAAPGVPTRGRVLAMAGTCDAFVAVDDVTSGAGEGAAVVIEGAGHLAFSDVCELDLLTLGETLLAPRDDVSPGLLDTFLALASDGCPGLVPDPSVCAAEGYLDLDTSDRVVRHYATVFFDQALYGHGDGPSGGVFPEATIP